MKLQKFSTLEILTLIGEIADNFKKASIVSRILLLMFDTSLG